MDIKNHKFFITGANRGLGYAIVKELESRNVSEIYAASRSGSALHSGEDTQDVSLDLEDKKSIAAAVQGKEGVSVLINVAGTLQFNSITDENISERTHQDMQVNLDGLLQLTNNFLPHLKEHSNAAVVNVLSLLSLASINGMAGYSASKAAAHSATQALRISLKDTGVSVLGAYPPGIDTDMLKGVEAEKSKPEDVAKAIVDGIESNEEYIFPTSEEAGKLYLTDPLAFEKMFFNI